MDIYYFMSHSPFLIFGLAVLFFLLVVGSLEAIFVNRPKCKCRCRSNKRAKK